MSGHNFLCNTQPRLENSACVQFKSRNCCNSQIWLLVHVKGLQLLICPQAVFYTWLC